MTMAVVPMTTLVKKGTGTATLMLTAKDTASHHSFNDKFQPSIYLMFITKSRGWGTWHGLQNYILKHHRPVKLVTNPLDVTKCGDLICPQQYNCEKKSSDEWDATDNCCAKGDFESDEITTCRYDAFYAR